MDTQETYKAFGPLIIDFSKIQSKIGVQYDNWHQDLLRKFGQIIQTVATEFHQNISEVLLDILSFSLSLIFFQHRENLETKSTDNLNDSVQLIDTIETVRQTQGDNDVKMKQLLEAQRLLERQRYSFPENWISMNTIENSWTSMNDSLKVKEQIVDRQLDTIQEKVKAEVHVLDAKSKELLEEWATKKPIGVNETPLCTSSNSSASRAT